MEPLIAASQGSRILHSDSLLICFFKRLITGTDTEPVLQTSSTGRNGTRRQVPYWQADCPGTPGMRQKTHRCPGATAVPAPDQMRFFTPDLCPQYTYRTAPQFTQPCYRPYRLSDRKSSVTAITVRIPAVTVSAIHSPLAGSPAAAESTATATEPTGKSGTSTGRT